MAVHIARVRLVDVDLNSNSVLDKSTIRMDQFLDTNFQKQHRVIVDASIPNTASQPTIKDYIEAEYADNFYLVHMDQFIIVTADGIPVSGGSSGGTLELDGVYDASTNKEPDNVGIIAHERVASPSDVEQIQRITADNPDTDNIESTKVIALDTNGFQYYLNGNDEWDRQRGSDGNSYVAVRDGTNQLDLTTIDSSYGATPTAVPIAAKYESVPTTYTDNDATPILVDQYGQVRIAGYDDIDNVINVNVNNQHSTSDTGVITFLNGVTASTTSGAYNSFQYSQWHIQLKVVTDASGAGDIYLDASVNNSDWATVLTQNIAAGSATTYNYVWTINGCYNYIRIRFVRSATTITVTVIGIGRGTL